MTFEDEATSGECQAMLSLASMISPSSFAPFLSSPSSNVARPWASQEIDRGVERARNSVDVRSDHARRHVGHKLAPKLSIFSSIS
jgi:hypothetical protein